MNWSNLVEYLQKYGLFFKSNKIYGGLANSYDLGPLGAELKNQIIEEWKKQFITQKENIVLIDGNLITKKEVLDASGHLKKFADYGVVCNNCHGQNKFEVLWPEVMINDDNFDNIKKTTVNLKQVTCGHCGKNIEVIKIKKFNLLFETGYGADKTKQQQTFLRPETAQNIFINLPMIVRTMRLQLPFGIAQIGKVFRNEITTQNLIFRTCEFSQMELEFFFAKSEQKTHWFNYWKAEINKFLLNNLQLNLQNIRIREHHPDELAHYSSRTIDFEYQFPFGWKELWGLADRDNYDLQVHQQKSGKKLTLLDDNNQPCLPFVIEPSVGIERLMLALICDKLTINQQQTQTQFVLKLPWKFCYYQIAILPLTEKLTDHTKSLYHQLKTNWRVKLDVKKSIGKRYVYHDAIGTYYCITFDFESLTDHKVTIRKRDTKAQQRIAIADLTAFLQNES